MDRQKLKVNKRTVFGNKVRKLRREGILPANIYGKNVKSLAIELPMKEFLTVYKDVGETGLVDLQVDGQIRPVLISSAQLHPVSDIPIHIDFRQVDLKEKIMATVPIELSGESPADKSGIGILVQQLTEIEVEALPTDLPEKLIADISRLENVDDAVLVSDLAVDRTKVEIQAEPSQIVAKVEPPTKEEEVAPAPEPVAEGEVPAEGTPAEESAEQPAATEGAEDKKEG